MYLPIAVSSSVARHDARFGILVRLHNHHNSHRRSPGLSGLAAFIRATNEACPDRHGAAIIFRVALARGLKGNEFEQLENDEGGNSTGIVSTSLP
ncbi:MAG: hypothetical protein QM756_34540 [Polyangiaceae bacterium]